MLRALLGCALAVALLLAPASALSEEDLDEILGGFEEEGDLDDALGGFDDEPAEPAAREEPDPSPVFLPSWLTLKGSLSFGASYGTVAHRAAALPDRKSWNGPNRLRTKLALEADVALPEDWKLRVSGFGFYDAIYRLRDADEYTNDALRRYETELELEEAWLRGSLHPRVDLKIGRQILNWGRSDTLRVLDVINPLDNRDPGLTDIENLRRPVSMVRLDGYAGDWNLTALLVPELRNDLLPPFGSDFVASPVRLPATRRPDPWGDDPEFGAALTGVFRGWDVSFHALRYWENAPRLETFGAAGPGPPSLRFTHDRRTLVGAGGNYSLGNWLLKAELAWIDGVRFSAAEESERVDVMGGVEYFGFDDVVIAFEVVNRHLVDWELAAKRAPDFQEEDSLESALRINWDLFNARLHLLALGIAFGETAQNGAIARVQATWDLRDALSVTGGYLLFVKGDRPPLTDWGDNDRVFAELSWSF